ncbi:UNC93-like protein MFSD11 isoform X2 [Macaca thibetana thibetana]|uniref:UNC93-like protein MFSD11 n=1 Tax=Macaca mulatta TaxID=9544 RepID=A0A5F7ZDZ3_MACMU|nr:UNC93-like protein MFSD11 isoform X3 [Macaca fascicularis]XP_017806491.1 UNC93-like protein MFSD11 isoform X2 [Papio anubis]XP_028692677.1 UNC93-like protein MFSD11 isoform X2 [Macaca mulatta]XP_050620308.1 UNC93-like protein MFSD11 isoform X2 [Macaca thibetana thibetana]
MSPESKKLFNIIILGVAFMFMFTAFQTCGNVAQTVIRSLNSTDFHGSGYTSMAIIYGVFSASNLITPSVVAIVGPQLSMFASGLFYSMYIAVFIQPFPWSFYTASVFIGIAAAVLWTAQGNCLTINSDEHTIGRNSGIFWALLQSSLFFGNLYIYFAWQGKTQISESDRRTVFIALTVISLVGTVLFFLIRKPDSENVLGEDESSDDQDMEVNESAQNNLTKAVDAFKKSFKLCVTKEMLLLSITTAYTGGSLFGLLSKNNRFGRNPVVLLGILVHFIAFYLIFLNMPGDAPIAPVKGTDSSAYIKSSKEVAILCSFLLGLGDSCFNTQLLSILGFLYSEDSAPAFAIFKFVQSICAAVAFFYSNYLLLHWQLLVMVIFGFFGTISFFTVEWEAAAFVARGSDYRSI